MSEVWYSNDCTHGDEWSYMWTPKSADYAPMAYDYEIPTLSEGELRQALLVSANFVRDLCIFSNEYELDTPRAFRCNEADDELEQLAGPYYFRGTTSISNFLRLNRTLIPVLFNIREQVNRLFSTTVLTDLKLFTDPEDDPTEPTLFVLILTDLPAREAIARLTRLDEEWWLDQPDSIQRLMNIDVEYGSGRF